MTKLELADKLEYWHYIQVIDELIDKSPIKNSTHYTREYNIAKIAKKLNKKVITLLSKLNGRYKGYYCDKSKNRFYHYVTLINRKYNLNSREIVKGNK